MKEIKLTESELALAEIIWESEPLKSSELVRICEDKFSWKKSTTYTMLKRLQEKKIALNVDSVITTSISRDKYYGERGLSFIEENFGGSLPKFITAFTGAKKLSGKDIEELQQLIDSHKEE